MALLLPVLGLLAGYFYFNGLGGVNRAFVIAVTLIVGYCALYFWPPVGLAYSDAKMGALFYGLPLGAFSLLLWAGDEDASGVNQWVGGLLGGLGLLVAIGLLVFFKFSYWPSFSS